jgi:hypothetical protein
MINYLVVTSLFSPCHLCSAAHTLIALRCNPLFASASLLAGGGAGRSGEVQDVCRSCDETTTSQVHVPSTTAETAKVQVSIVHCCVVTNERRRRQQEQRRWRTIAVSALSPHAEPKMGRDPVRRGRASLQRQPRVRQVRLATNSFCPPAFAVQRAASARTHTHTHTHRNTPYHTSTQHNTAQHNTHTLTRVVSKHCSPTGTLSGPCCSVQTRASVMGVRRAASTLTLCGSTLTRGDACCWLTKTVGGIIQSFLATGRTAGTRTGKDSRLRLSCRTPSTTLLQTVRGL